MKKILLTLLLLSASVFAGTKYQKKSCKNYKDKPDKNRVRCIPCEEWLAMISSGSSNVSEQDESVTCDQSLVDTLTYNLIHSSTDYKPSKTAGCGSCSTGSPSGVVPQLSLVRFHKYRNMSDRGSFGPGIFSNWDTGLHIFEVNGETRIDVFEPASITHIRRYFKIDNSFKDTHTETSKGITLYDSSDAITVDYADAVRAVLETKNKEFFHFDIFELDSGLKGGRFTKFVDKKGYTLEISYEHAVSAVLGDDTEKWKIDTVSDKNNRILTFTYLSSQKNSQWVVEKITQPNGADITYAYGTIALEGNEHLKSITFPDSTVSTFSYGVDGVGNSTVTIFDAGEKGFGRQKTATMDSNFVVTNRKDGVYRFNSASLLIDKITKGSAGNEEVSFEIFQHPTKPNRRRVYEGGNKLKYIHPFEYTYYKSWTQNDPSPNHDDFTASKESTSTHYQTKFKSANGKGAFPVAWDRNGNKYQYLYNSDEFAKAKIYEDTTRESWEYDSFNQVTRYRDRLARVTRKTYNSVTGNIESIEKGIQATVVNSNTRTTGLTVSLYTVTGSSLPNFASLPPLEVASTSNVTLDSEEVDTYYGLVYEGDIDITSAGDYTFWVNSDDGSRLYIDGNLVVDNDGVHTAAEVQSALVNLTTGLHTFKLEYFQKTGSELLQVYYQGDDTYDAGTLQNEKIAIPEEVYSHIPTAAQLVETDVDVTEDYGKYEFTYHSSGNGKDLLATEKDANGNIVSYAYNSDNLLVTVTEPNDNGVGTHTKASYTYDSAKRTETATDGVGRITTYEYDSRDRASRVTYHDGSMEVFVYGSGADANMLVKKRDRNGNVTKFEYDSLGRRIKTFTAYQVWSDTAVDSAKVTSGINVSFTDPGTANENPSSLQSVRECTFLDGTTLVSSCIVNGDRTDYEYDYRHRLIKTTRYADANSKLISESEYKDNLLFKTVDAYGRKSYRQYRDGDSALLRTIQETVPTLSLTFFSQVGNKSRLGGTNEAYLITDYEPDAEQQVEAVVDPRGIRHEASFDTRGRSIQQINDAGGINQTTDTYYDANSNVTEIRHPRYTASFDDVTTMTYGDRNFLKTRTVAAGSAVSATESFTYYDDGRAKDHTDFRGYTSTKEWHNCCGRFQAGIDQAGHASVSSTDFYGNVTHTAVLENYTPSTAVDQPSADLGGTATQSEHNYNNSKTLQEVTIRYDQRHRPIAQTVWLDEKDGTTYSKLGAVQANAVPIYGDGSEPANTYGLTTQTFYYDETTGHPELAPLLTELTNDGITFDADADGSAVISVNAEGEVAVSIQDGVGRTVATGMYDKDDWALPTPIYTLVTWSTVTHDTIVNDLLETKTTSALGFENKSQTDGAGRTIKTIDAEGEDANFEYDANSNLLKSRDANLVGMDCVFDNLNRDTSCTDTDEDTTSKVYDLNNNVLKAVDGLGKFSLAAYDERNRATNQWDRLVTDGYDGNLPPEADSTRYTYDNNSNVTNIEDVLEKETVYDYDVRNLVEKTTYPDHVGGTSAGDANYGITKCSFDALRRKDVCTDQLGDNVTYIYDLASRLLKREYRLEDTTLESTDTFTYDDVSRVLSANKGRYSNTCTYTYDVIGRRKTETTTVNGDSYTVTSEIFDNDSRLKEIYYPTGTDAQNNNVLTNRNKLVNGFTDRNQLETVSFAGANIVTSTYDDGGREETRTFGNGLVNTMTYNLDNTRDGISVAGESNLSFDYTYDANKNVKSETSAGTIMDDYNFTAGFDDQDRVTQWDRSNLDSQTWTQDLIGNWSNTTGILDGNSFNENRTHNDAHELTDMGGNSVSYDAKGNMTTDAWLNSLTWDIDNHLKTHGAVDFTYDALGRRLEKKTSTGNTLYICNGQRVVEEYTDDLLGGGYQLARSYVHGSYIDDLLAKIEGGNTLFFHTDRQYNIRGLTDSNGDIIELYAYSVYGKRLVLASTGTVLVGSSYNNFYGFTGRYIDTETNLWYFRARYFSDEMGRFINRDPLGYVDGLSLYNAYFAEGFGLDPWGTEELKVNKKNPTTTKNLWEYTPSNPNDNDCKNSCNVIAIAEHVNKGDYVNNKFIEDFHRRYKKSGVKSFKDFAELNSAIACPDDSSAKIKHLIIGGHGEKPQGGRLLYQPKDYTGKGAKGFAHKGNQKDWIGAFNRDRFCCNCQIWLLSCLVGGTDLPQLIAEETGCTVYAWDICVTATSRFTRNEMKKIKAWDWNPRAK